MGKSISQLGGMGIQMGAQAASGIVDKGLGLLFAGPERKAQLKTAKGLQDLQIAGNKEMTDYQMSKQLQMWKDTSYGAQKEQMEKAGINPALMYGMGGGGGQTTGSASGNVSGQSAETPEGSKSGGMGLQGMMLQAQIENIKADTEQKKAAANDLTNSAEGKGLANALTAWMQGTDLEGNQVGEDMGKSTRGLTEREGVKKIQAEIKTMMDRNQREKLMNNAAIKKITEEISLMKKKGLTETQILANLEKEGKLKDAEIEWNALDLEPGNWGKFITNIIKLAFK